MIKSTKEMVKSVLIYRLTLCFNRKDATITFIPLTKR